MLALVCLFIACATQMPTNSVIAVPKLCSKDMESPSLSRCVSTLTNISLDQRSWNTSLNGNWSDIYNEGCPRDFGESYSCGIMDLPYFLDCHCLVLLCYGFLSNRNERKSNENHEFPVFPRWYCSFNIKQLVRRNGRDI